MSKLPPQTPETPNPPGAPQLGQPPKLTSEEALGAPVGRGAQEWSSEAANAPLTPESRFVAVIGVRLSEADGEALVVDLLGDRYFRLNQTGLTLWKLATTSTPLGLIAANLSSTYGVAIEEMNVIATAFAGELERSRLLVRSG